MTYIEDGAGNTTPGSWRSHINDSFPNTLAKAQRERLSALQARLVRDTLKEYFFNEGAVDFQWNMTE